MSSTGYQQHFEPIAARLPPVNKTGLMAWIQRGFFDGPVNSLLTVLFVAMLVWAIPPIFNWTIWNTMPTWRLTASIDFTSSVSSVPSTLSTPDWCSSRRLTQRISVLLPEPEGPHTTMRSPLATDKSMSRNTWNSPNHLLTLENSMMGLEVLTSLSPCSSIQMGFQPLAVA